MCMLMRGRWRQWCLGRGRRGNDGGEPELACICFFVSSVETLFLFSFFFLV